MKLWDLTKEFSLRDGVSVRVNGSSVQVFGLDGRKMFEHTITRIVSPFENFFLMGKDERKKVATWYRKESRKEKPGDCSNRANFMCDVEHALESIDYDYYIATLEPSVDDFGDIYYEEGAAVECGCSQFGWQAVARTYYTDEEWQSNLACLLEGVLFKAYRIAMGYWTIDFVCEGGEMITGKLEKSGVVKVGGFSDGINNTREIYKGYDKGDKEPWTYVCGGSFKEAKAPASREWYYEREPHPDGWTSFEKEVFFNDARGVLVIRRKLK